MMSAGGQQPVAAGHQDLIHDVAFDFHGRRMATCSSDQSVKVWDQYSETEWVCTASWKTHSGSVWKIVWAHPEFGQVLCTCSFDRTAAIWEELVGGANTSECGKSHWVKRTSLVYSRTSVTDVQFAPKHLGLLLATCSADGMVRVYEAPDVMNLSQWSLQEDFNCKLTCSCLSWNPSRNHPPMIAVGSDDPNTASGAKVFIYEHIDSQTRWMKVESVLTVTDSVHSLSFAPNLGRSYHLLAIASKDIKVITLKPVKSQNQLLGASNSRFELRQAAEFLDQNSHVWRVVWNITGTVLASSGDDGSVKMWKPNYLGNWKCIGTLKCDSTAMAAAAAAVASSSSTTSNDSSATTLSTKRGLVVNSVEGFSLLQARYY